MQLFKMEGPDSTEKILPRTIEVAATIISIYIILTFLCGFFYWIFGMTIFDSISHSMTTIATGGFSTHDDSIGFFKNSYIEIVSSIFIILGSIPFISYLKFVQGNRKVFFQDVQIDNRDTGGDGHASAIHHRAFCSVMNLCHERLHHVKSPVQSFQKKHKPAKS